MEEKIKLGLRYFNDPSDAVLEEVNALKAHCRSIENEQGRCDLETTKALLEKHGTSFWDIGEFVSPEPFFSSPKSGRDDPYIHESDPATIQKFLLYLQRKDSGSTIIYPRCDTCDHPVDPVDSADRQKDL